MENEDARRARSTGLGALGSPSHPSSVLPEEGRRAHQTITRPFVTLNVSGGQKSADELR